MDRLTKRDDSNGLIGVYVTGHDYIAAAHKLAEYEDTGLTPERCAELAKAVDEGRIMEAPCRVGDTAYCWYKETDGSYHIDTFIVKGILHKADGWYILDKDDNIDKIGTQYAMLTREEAEAAIRKEKQHD